MNARVLQSTSPNVYQHHAAKDGASQKPSRWAITNLLSTQDAKQYKFLSKVYIPGRTATNQRQYDDLRSKYQENAHSFHQNLYAKAAFLETIFQHATQDKTKLFFIHAVCDAAHTYTYAPNADPRLQNIANSLLNTHLKLFEIDGYIPKTSFLSDGTTFKSIYLKDTKDMYVVAPYGPHFGNVLFRLTPHTGDMCFSPLFINYLNRDLSGITPKAYRYEDLAKDEHFYTKGSGFKTLTDRDAVAHYRWLTETHSHAAFTTYLTNIGHSADKTEYTFQERKDLLAELSKNYWRLGHGATMGSGTSHTGGLPVPPLRLQTMMQNMGTSPMKLPSPPSYSQTEKENQHPNHDATQQFKPHSGLSNSWQNTYTMMSETSDDETHTRPRSLYDGEIGARSSQPQAHVWPDTRHGRRVTNVYHTHNYYAAPRYEGPQTASAFTFADNRQTHTHHRQESHAYHNYHDHQSTPLQTARQAPKEWKNPSQKHIPTAFYIKPTPYVYAEPVYMKMERVTKPLFYTPVVEKQAKSVSYKMLSFCKKVVSMIRYS